MPSEVTREEFESRVGALEGEVEGEKLVTRHILEQTRRNGDDLAAVRTRLDRVEGKVDEMREDVRGVKTATEGLIRTLPKIVGDAVRGALRGRKGKS
jgi:uncharacterized protein YoxC